MTISCGERGFAEIVHASVLLDVTDSSRYSSEPVAGSECVVADAEVTTIVRFGSYFAFDDNTP